jgi:hypothetical protein
LSILGNLARPSGQKVKMSSETPSFGSIRGLNEADAQTRLKAEGYKELPQPDRGSLVVRGTGIGEVVGTGIRSEIA